MIHGAWALVVAVAFAAGSFMRSGSSAKSGGSVAGPDSRASGPSSRTLSGQAGGERASTADGGLVSRAFGKLVLSGSGIEVLASQACNDPNPITRRMAFSKLLESMTVENAIEIRAQLLEMNVGGREWNDFNYAWGAIAGEEAFAFARESEEQDMAATMTGWAAARPEEALALLENLPEGMAEERGALTQSVISGLADYDQTVASDYVLKLAGEGYERADRLIDIVANEVLRAGGAEEAAKWTESLPAGAVKASAMDEVAERYVEQDPEAAAEWATQFADEDYAAQAIAEIGGEWAERDPVAAVNWLEELPEGAGQISGFRSALGDWEDRDPVAAGEYLLTMAQSPQRDAAISGFTRGYARQDPETAIAWAQDISDPVMRERSLTDAGESYFRRDPEGARAWLPNSGLSAEAQQQVINRAARGRRR